MPPRILPRASHGEPSADRQTLAMPFLRGRASAPPAPDRSGACLRVSERDIRRIARAHGPRTPIALIVARQAWHETRIRVRKQVTFRRRENDAACSAYCAMDLVEFEGINARQSWANWRTIPRNLTGRLPNRPILAIDLCCGIGQSTDVLAYYLASGSRILGLEYNPDFVAQARARDYRDQHGRPADASFRAQSVLDTFREANDAVVADGSVDLVNACGAVGCHFDGDASRTLAREVARVLAPGGLAMIDAGEAGTREADLVAIFAAHDFELLHRSRSCLLDRYRQLCLQKRH